MSSVNFKEKCMEGDIHYDQEFIYVKGTINDNVHKGLIEYLAACPVEKRLCPSASGMPYANADIAFYNTPNKGTVELSLGNKFNIKLKNPSSYYVGLGTVLIPPTLFIRYKSVDKIKLVSIKVNEPVPYRTLTYPMQRKDPTFYNPYEPKLLRSSEQIFKDSTYPVFDTVRYPKVPEDNYWRPI